MQIEFATCERNKALDWIRQVYPSATIEDAPESAGPLLDFIEQDRIRIQDPMMYGHRINVVPGRKWVETVAGRKAVLAAVRVLRDSLP